MWGIWRVYNTLQDGAASTDALPPLPPLPDRAATTVDAGASAVRRSSTAAAVDARDLPTGSSAAAAAGRARRATTPRCWTGTEAAGRIVGEPETDAVWPGYRSPQPGRAAADAVRSADRQARLPVPAAAPRARARRSRPNHGPAAVPRPPAPTGADPPRRAPTGPESLCPAGTHAAGVRRSAPSSCRCRSTQRPASSTRPGMLFVLDRGRGGGARRPDAPQVPLAIRANAGEDCVDVLLTQRDARQRRTIPSARSASTSTSCSSTCRRSDGVDTGFNYEQTVRPFAAEGEALTAATPPARPTRAWSAAPTRFSPACWSASAWTTDADVRDPPHRRRSSGAGTLVFDRPLEHAHAAGEIVSTEFVRYRWYPDVQFGTAYFHDHVNGIRTWQHGLFGAARRRAARRRPTTTRDGRTR